MVIDTSALVAMISKEPEAAEFAALVSADSRRLLSVISLVETAIVMERRYGAPGSRELDMVLRGLSIELAPVTPEQGQSAMMAYWRFGRTIHPAALNFGDCFVYALAKVTGEPLLFKGNDFSLTDVALAR